MENQAKKPVIDFPSSQLSKCCLEQCLEISSVSQHVSKLNECVPNVEKCIEYELKTAIKTPKSQLNRQASLTVSCDFQISGIPHTNTENLYNLFQYICPLNTKLFTALNVIAILMVP